MTGPLLLGAPTIAGKAMVPIQNTRARHVAIFASSRPYEKTMLGAAPASGQQYGHGTSTSSIAGGPGHSWMRGVGTWGEYNLGMLDLDRQWEIWCAWWGSSDRGVIQLSVNGVNIGATFTQYNVNSATPMNALRTWNPVAGDKDKESVLRVTITAAGAGGGTYGGFANIYLDRTLGVPTI